MQKMPQRSSDYHRSYEDAHQITHSNLGRIHRNDSPAAFNGTRLPEMNSCSLFASGTLNDFERKSNKTKSCVKLRFCGTNLFSQRKDAVY
jgi:hypothetical protein